MKRMLFTPIFFDSANGGSVVGTNAPYIHLLVCRQS